MTCMLCTCVFPRRIPNRSSLKNIVRTHTTTHGARLPQSCFKDYTLPNKVHQLGNYIDYYSTSAAVSLFFFAEYKVSSGETQHKKSNKCLHAGCQCIVYVTIMTPPPFPVHPRSSYIVIPIRCCLWSGHTRKQSNSLALLSISKKVGTRWCRSSSYKRFLEGCSSPFMRLVEHLTALRAWRKQCLPNLW